jgi:hypothetical protein
MKNVAGIDPGLSGALAVLNESGVVLVEDLPIYQLPSSKRLRAELDLATLRQLLCARAIDHARMSPAASPRSMLPSPPRASEPVYVIRLRMRLHSELESRRRRERENLRLRTEIARLQSLLRKRACK